MATTLGWILDRAIALVPESGKTTLWNLTVAHCRQHSTLYTGLVLLAVGVVVGTRLASKKDTPKTGSPKKRQPPKLLREKSTNRQGPGFLHPLEGPDHAWYVPVLEDWGDPLKDNIHIGLPQCPKDKARLNNVMNRGGQCPTCDEYYAIGDFDRARESAKGRLLGMRSEKTYWFDGEKKPKEEAPAFFSDARPLVITDDCTCGQKDIPLSPKTDGFTCPRCARFWAA